MAIYNRLKGESAPVKEGIAAEIAQACSRSIREGAILSESEQQVQAGIMVQASKRKGLTIGYQKRLGNAEQTEIMALYRRPVVGSSVKLMIHQGYADSQLETYRRQCNRLGVKVGDLTAQEAGVYSEVVASTDNSPYLIAAGSDIDTSDAKVGYGRKGTTVKPIKAPIKAVPVKVQEEIRTWFRQALAQGDDEMISAARHAAKTNRVDLTTL